MIVTGLLIAALVCLLMQALELNVPKISVGFLGLFFWCLAVAWPSVLAHIVLVLVILLVAILVIVLINRRP